MDRFLSPTDAWSGRAIGEPERPAGPPLDPELERKLDPTDRAWRPWRPTHRPVSRHDLGELAAAGAGCLIAFLVWLAITPERTWTGSGPRVDETPWDLEMSAFVVAFVGLMGGVALYERVARGRWPWPFGPSDRGPRIAGAWRFLALFASMLVLQMSRGVLPGRTIDDSAWPTVVVVDSPMQIAIRFLAYVGILLALWGVAMVASRPD
ncbi:MAG: hypothetical protein U0869_23670 [Chloroflexota bacterium]